MPSNVPRRVGTDRWVSVSATTDRTFGVTTDGTLWAWGANSGGALGDGTTTDRPSPVRIAPGQAWASVSAGTWIAAAITTEGALWTWDDQAETQPLTPTREGTDTSWVTVSAGWANLLATRR